MRDVQPGLVLDQIQCPPAPHCTEADTAGRRFHIRPAIFCRQPAGAESVMSGCAVYVQEVAVRPSLHQR